MQNIKKPLVSQSLLQKAGIGIEYSPSIRVMQAYNYNEIIMFGSSKEQRMCKTIDSVTQTTLGDKGGLFGPGRTES